MYGAVLGLTQGTGERPTAAVRASGNVHRDADIRPSAPTPSSVAGVRPPSCSPWQEGHGSERCERSHHWLFAARRIAALACVLPRGSTTVTAGGRSQLLAYLLSLFALRVAQPFFYGALAVTRLRSVVSFDVI